MTQRIFQWLSCIKYVHQICYFAFHLLFHPCHSVCTFLLDFQYLVGKFGDYKNSIRCYDYHHVVMEKITCRRRCAFNLVVSLQKCTISGVIVRTHNVIRRKTVVCIFFCFQYYHFRAISDYHINNQNEYIFSDFLNKRLSFPIDIIDYIPEHIMKSFLMTMDISHASNNAQLSISVANGFV